MRKIRKLAALALAVIMSVSVLSMPKASAIDEDVVLPKGVIVPCPRCKENAYEAFEERRGAPTYTYCDLCQVPHEMPTVNVYKKTVCSVCSYESDLRFYYNYCYCTK